MRSGASITAAWLRSNKVNHQLYRSGRPLQQSRHDVVRLSSYSLKVLLIASCDNDIVDLRNVLAWHNECRAHARSRRHSESASLRCYKGWCDAACNKRSESVCSTRAYVNPLPRSPTRSPENAERQGIGQGSVAQTGRGTEGMGGREHSKGFVSNKRA